MKRTIIQLLLLNLAVFQSTCMAFAFPGWAVDFWNALFAPTSKYEAAYQEYYEEKIECFKPKDVLAAIKATKTDDISTDDISMIPEHTIFTAHISLLQEIKGLSYKVREFTQKDRVATTHDAKLTQTEAYIERYTKEISNAFSNPFDYSENMIKKYKHLINEVMIKERELADTHYFFYHAHDKNFIILQDFIKLLTSYMQLIVPRSDFSCMRLKGMHTIPYKNVNEYLDAHPSIHDHIEPTRNHMISVNLSIFGNHDLISGWECTFDYFVKNKSLDSNLRKRLEAIFEHYALDKKYIDELTDLTCYLISPTGNLLQICIPHDMVDDLVYLSHPLGRPYRIVETFRIL